MTFLRKPGILIFATFCLVTCAVQGQQLISSERIGGSGKDEGNKIVTDAAGNSYVTGKFSGTNVDFDPSPSQFLMTSAGATDAFVVKYDNAGTFLWAFRFGGANLDEINDLVIDVNNDIYISGFFRGPGVDFNPGAGTALLTSHGDSGGDPGYGGDIFLAKYNANGAYIWAFNIGGPFIGDNSSTLKTDAGGNVYLGGYFAGVVDFDPGAGTTTLDWTTGTVYLAKFSGGGAFQWVRNWGIGAQDNALFGMTVDNAGNIIATGFFQGSNIDFDPGPGTRLLSAAGGFEFYLTKFSPAGQLIWAYSLGNYGTDVGRSVVTDAADNIYVIGDFNSTVDFDPGPGISTLTSNGSGDVFLAKYSSSGIYQWAFSFGGVTNDFGWKVTNDGAHLLVTGGFTGTSDMNPSSATDNLISKGGYDIFIGKYTFNGEYLCAFSIGGPGDDQGYAIHPAALNTFFMTGSFSGSNIDFDPTGAVFNLTSLGGLDIFYSKYFWPDNPRPYGTLAGGAFCRKEDARLTYTSSAGVAPFTITYTDGTDTYIATNVQSGVPFDIPDPVAATTFTLTGIRDAQKCSETNLVNLPSGVLVEVGSLRATNDTTLCPNASLQLQASGASTYQWSGPTGLSDANISNPVLVATSPAQYIVTGTGPNNCVIKDTVNINIHSPTSLTVTNDTTLCGEKTFQLNASGGTNYVWAPAIGLNNPMIANPVLTTTSSIKFIVTASDLNRCEVRDSVTVGVFPAVSLSASADAQACINSRLQLLVTGGHDYQWTPAAGLDNSFVSNPVATIQSPVQYVVTASDGNGCAARDTVNITLFDIPEITVTSDTAICTNSTLQLRVSGGDMYVWTPAIGLDNPNSANPIATPSAEINYKVEVVDNNNCKYYDSVAISFKPPPVFTINPSVTVCRGDSVQLHASGGEVYNWSPSATLSSSVISNPRSGSESTTQFAVTIRELTCNTEATLSTIMQVLPVPDVIATKSNDLDCSNGSARLTATGAKSYSWQPAQYLSNAFVSNPVASGRITTNYIVRGEAVNGCAGYDTIQLEFNNSNKSDYLVPTAFTPNNDNKNDCFSVALWGIIDDIEFSVFNRWGQRVYFSRSANACWNGTINGQPAPADVYVYMIRGKTACDPSVFRKGTFVLIR